MGEAIQYVFAQHFRLAVHALILFLAGAFAACPVLRYRLTAVEWLPLRIFSAIVRLMGPAPTLARMVAVIWAFNSAAMFVYMASGFHPMAPKAFAVWTGLNVVIIGVRAGRGDDPALAPFGRAAPGQWRPPRGPAVACGVLVLGLELPCFWCALAMGIRMGWEVQAGASYLDALPARAVAYAAVLMPVLLVSAVAESVAIRAAARDEDWCA